jgi:FKBP-type peptidyl-prolyl cis-trans isomerase FklB
MHLTEPNPAFNQLFLPYKKPDMLKKIKLFFLLILTTGYCISQTPKTKPAVKSTPSPASVLKDLRDSASYALGIFLFNFFREQGITNINSSLVARSIADLQSKKKPLLSDQVANNAIMAYQGKLQSQKSRPVIEAGLKFLSDNRQRAGVVSLPSGLQYEIINEGTGPRPVLTDTVICNYTGTFIDGKEFDNSYKTGQPATFAVTGVIAGWTEALLLMPVGSKWKLYVPYQLGYGISDYYNIPGGSVLIFELELLGIKGK